MADQDLRDLVASSRRGAIVALKRDGRPQLSNVVYAFDPDRGGQGLLRFSTKAGSAKVANLRRDPRVSVYVTGPDFRVYAVAEGTAAVSEVSAAPDDATVEELVDVYRRIAGEHPNWDEYRAAMVAERRVVVRIDVDRYYGAAGW
ncbi:PPOX class F420-dependent oxidoreductase [Streptacidiphilus sp. MAP5-3]|uniref:PPOX class F420-dependent oxidoreductase n=1 Tax=unclassified Streptacidiphilus TaxID=2643834 RepID=UPI0035147C01